VYPSLWDKFRLPLSGRDISLSFYQAMPVLQNLKQILKHPDVRAQIFPRILYGTLAVR